MRVIAVKIFAVSFLLTAGSAHAEMTARETLQGLEQGNTSITFYLAGITQALGWANTTVELNLKRHLFCQPNMAITSDQNRSILRSYIERNVSARDMPVGAVMLSAYAEVFPCK